ncbi:nuclear transport factor 2 family protein [Novosphingobium sp.]|uniref:nuclear transport factor 2 family protein n=1 Tax=Novosphingobium sp. TaxID=1874826 RepID=UPI003B516360
MRIYTAVAAGDVPAVLNVLADHLDWTEAAGFPYYSGTWHCPMDVVEKLLVPIGRDWDDFAASPHEFIDLGDRVLTLGTYSGVCKATGKAMAAPFAHIWRVAGDRITVKNLCECRSRCPAISTANQPNLRMRVALRTSL